MNKLSLLTLVALIVVGQSFAFATEVKAANTSDFRAGNIIDDSVFTNNDSMSINSIQNFLNSKNSVCLKDFQTLSLYDSNNDGYGDEPYGKGQNEKVSAAKLIWQAAQIYDINPQVILVTLQKEQGLITRTDCPSWRYNTALGYGCPDSAPCDTSAYGFTRQIDYGTWHFRGFFDDSLTYVPYTPGNRNIAYNPSSSCGSSTVNILNRATASLYSYTPYQPNQAALDAGYGTGNSCSAYGNRNFWLYFTDWFGSTTGTPFFRIGSSDAVYIMGANNTYYHAPSWQVMRAYGYGINFNKVDSRPSSYISGKTNAGTLPIAVRFEGDEVYLTDHGRIHHFPSSQLMGAYGFTIGQEAKLTEPDKNFFNLSTTMRTILRHTDGPEIYSVESGKKRHIINQEAYNSGDPTYSSLSDVMLNTNTASLIANGAPIMTADKLVKRTDLNTFAFWDGNSLQNISNLAINELGLNPDYSAGSSTINQLDAGSGTINKLVKNSSGQLYLLDNRQKFLVASGDLAELGLTTNSFTLTSDGFLNKVNSTVPFVRIFRINDSSAVYLVDDGQRHHFHSSTAINEKGFNIASAVNINSTSASQFPYSGKKILASGTLFRIGSAARVSMSNGGSSSLYVPSKLLLSDYGLSINDVYSFSSGEVSGYPENGILNNFVKDGSNNVWLISLGKKRAVSSNMQQTSRYNVNASDLATLSHTLLVQFPQQNALTELIQAAGDSKVYKVENGAKRWITTSTKFNELGYSFSDVTSVSQYFAGTLPTGTNIN